MIIEQLAADGSVLSSAALGLLSTSGFTLTSAHLWLDNNRCNTESGVVRSSVCNTGE